MHTGSVAVPTALAVGEALGASGAAVLEALIAVAGTAIAADGGCSVRAR